MCSPPVPSHLPVRLDKVTWIGEGLEVGLGPQGCSRTPWPVRKERSSSVMDAGGWEAQRVLHTGLLESPSWPASAVSPLPPPALTVPLLAGSFVVFCHLYFLAETFGYEDFLLLWQPSLQEAGFLDTLLLGTWPRPVVGSPSPSRAALCGGGAPSSWTQAPGVLCSVFLPVDSADLSCLSLGLL